MDYVLGVTAVGIATYWHASRNSPKRKSKEQLARDAVPALVVLDGKVINATGVGLRRGNDCRIVFRRSGAEVYKRNIYRPDTFVNTFTYIGLGGIGWRSRQAPRSRMIVGAGHAVGGTFVAAASRMPQPPPIGYIMFGMEIGSKMIAVECRADNDGLLRSVLLPAIRSAGGNPTVETYDR